MRGVMDPLPSLVVGPTAEPLTLDEAKAYLRFKPTSEDALITGMIAAARMQFEKETDRQAMTATWEWWLPGFPLERVIELPKPPLQQVLSVTYDDGTGVDVVLDPASYRVLAPAGPLAPRGRLVLPSGGGWPSTGAPGAVRIQFTAGYGATPSDVPALVKTCIGMYLGSFHKMRSETYETPAASAQVIEVPVSARLIIEAYMHTAKAQVTLTYAGVATWP